MSKEQLKAAMAQLDIKNPLRLKESAPKFRSPGEIVFGDRNTSQDQITSRVINPLSDTFTSVGEILSKVMVPTQGEEVSKDVIQPKDTPVSQVIIAPEDIAATKDQNITQDENSPQVVERSSQPRLATDQDKAVVQVKAVESKLANGYTRLPNSIMMKMVEGDLSRAEIKVLLLIARMTISFNRKLVPLSKGVIERMTGLQGSVILQTVHALEQAGLITKIPGDKKRPNELGLVFDSTCFDGGSSKASSGEKISQDQKLPTDIKTPAGLGENPPYFKDSIKNINSLSQKMLTKRLLDYFSNLKPKAKRDSEFKYFLELNQEYTVEEIELCLDYIMSKGVLISGTVCHSPMAYLGRAIPQVIDIINKKSEHSHQTRVKKGVSDEKLRPANEAIHEKEAAKRFAKIEHYFNKQFRYESDKQSVLSKYREKLPFLDTQGAIYRRLAMELWFIDENNTQE